MNMQIVVAVAENDVIGRRNALPWRLPADLRRFKALTLGKPILMGRRTYQSIGRALPGRLNLVLSKSGSFSPGDCTVVADLEQAREAAGRDATGREATGREATGREATGREAEIMVIGGAQIYRQCLPLTSRIHLTLVHTRVEDGDTFFDGWRGAEWRESFRERHEADEANSCAYSFVTLDRAGKGASFDSTSRAARA
jgi:dihydrofolate reductase